MTIDKHMLENARKQFCLDTNMPWEEYLAEPNKKVYIHKSIYQFDESRIGVTGARKPEKSDAFFKAIICMGQLFLMADEQIYDWAVKQFENCSPEWFCKYNNLRKIDDKLWEYNREIADTHIYFLPEEMGKEKETLPLLPLQWFEKQEIMKWKKENCFAHALSFSKTQPDMLAVAAMKQEGNWAGIVPSRKDTQQFEQKGIQKDMEQEHMAAMAGISADGEYLWQIGIDVEKQQRGWGLGTNLVKILKEEIINRGITPYYGTSESHIISQKIARKAGFIPAWTELFIQKIRPNIPNEIEEADEMKEIEEIDKMEIDRMQIEEI